MLVIIRVFFNKNNLFTVGYQLEVVVNSINCNEIMLRVKDEARIVHTKNKQARLKHVRKVGIYQREIWSSKNTKHKTKGWVTRTPTKTQEWTQVQTTSRILSCIPHLSESKLMQVIIVCAYHMKYHSKSIVLLDL